MEKKDTKAEIIAVGTDLISIQGYNATGIDALLKRAGVPKGSFYHYFGSKEDFGLAVIDNFAQRYDRILDMFFDDENTTPLNRMRNYLETALSRLTQNQCSKGCLIGNLGQELADQNERFRARIQEIFDSWKGRYTVCLKEAQQSGELSKDVDPAVIAGFILSGLEGAILSVKVTKSPKPFEDFVQTVFTTVLKP